MAVLITAVLLGLVWAAHQWDERRLATREAAFVRAWSALTSLRAAFWRARLALDREPAGEVGDRVRSECERLLVVYRGALARVFEEFPAQTRRGAPGGSYADPELEVMVEAFTLERLTEALLRHGAERTSPAHAHHELHRFRRPGPDRLERALGGALGGGLGGLVGLGVFGVAHLDDTSAG